MVNYPEEFKQKTLALFPDSEEIKQYLEDGNEILGRILDDTRLAAGVKPEELVAACENVKLMPDLYKRCKRAIEIGALLDEYYVIRGWRR